METIWHVELQPDGWPQGIDDDAKRELTEVVQRELQRQPMALHILHDLVRRQRPRPRALEGASLIEWIYCAIDRAARAANAEQVYMVEEIVLVKRDSLWSDGKQGIECRNVDAYQANDYYSGWQSEVYRTLEEAVRALSNRTKKPVVLRDGGSRRYT